MSRDPTLGPGYVYTGTGEKLNMDELITKARRPLNDRADHKDKIVKRDAPRVNTGIVRGFRPAAGGVSATVGTVASVVSQTTVEAVQPVTAEKAPPSAYAGGEAKSLADLTGVKLDEPRRMRGKAKDAVAESAKALKEVLTATVESTVDRTSDPNNEKDWRNK